MGELKLSGTLNLTGMLTLSDKVTVAGQEALVESTSTQGNAPGPVMIPPPPAGPSVTGVDVHVIASFNKTVKAGSNAIVAQGLVLQASVWPGMVLPGSATVTIDHIPVNVLGDQAIILPSGMSVPLSSASGQ
jgi:hypothetical protein